MKALGETFAARPRLWIGVVSFIVFGSVAFFLISAFLTPEPPSTATQPQIQMHQVIGQGEQGNRLGWRFIADSSDLSTDGQVTTYHNVRLGEYYLKGKPAYKLTASEVTLDMRSQNYTASGNVHIWSIRPHDLSNLKTENVLWNNPLQTLTCPGDVYVRYKGFNFVSSHLQVNLINGTSTLGSTTIHSTR
jgi:LPS export ABC transporter protein LptC